MDFGLLPPEVNSGLMYTGPGSGPMLAAAAGWDSLAAELESAASGYWSSISELLGTWFGPTSMAMTAAVSPYVTWLHASAAAAGETAAQAYSAVVAYEAAFAMTVPPPAIVANRTLKMALIATNFFGQNTPAIAATEAQYMGMWAQDAAAMYGYAGASSSASTLTSFSEPPQTTNADGQAAQGRSVAQAAGNAIGARTQSVMQLANATQPIQIFGPGTYGAGDYTVAAGGSIIVEQGGTLVIGPGASLIVDQGATLTIGPGATFNVLGSGTFVTLEQGAIVTLAPMSEVTFGSAFTTVTVNIGPTSTLAVAEGAQVSLVSGSMSIMNSTVNVTGFLGAPTATATAHDTIAINGGVVSTTGLAQATGVDAAPPGVVVAPPGGGTTAGGGVAAAASVPTPTGLVTSPGLAGTSAIQPQLNADLLFDWAQAVPAADLAGAVG